MVTQVAVSNTVGAELLRFLGVDPDYVVEATIKVKVDHPIVVETRSFAHTDDGVLLSDLKLERFRLVRDTEEV